MKILRVGVRCGRLSAALPAEKGSYRTSSRAGWGATPAVGGALLGLLGACGSTSAAPVPSTPTPSADRVVPTVNSRTDGPAVPCTGLTIPLSSGGGKAGGGDRLPKLSLGCLGGGPNVDLAAVRGPALLNVWASWCGPCAQEAPYLVDAHQSLGATVRFVGLDLGDDPADARAWSAFHHVDWPSLADPQNKVRGPLRVIGPPVTFFIRSDGTLAGVHYGAFTSTDAVRTAVAQQLGPVAKAGSS